MKCYLFKDLNGREVGIYGEDGDSAALCVLEDTGAEGLSYMNLGILRGDDQRGGPPPYDHDAAYLREMRLVVTGPVEMRGVPMDLLNSGPACERAYKMLKGKIAQDRPGDRSPEMPSGPPAVRDFVVELTPDQERRLNPGLE
jgi:hypothetical protein